LVLNPDYARGQLSSMQCGLRAVPSEADGVLFTLVDHPAVSESTVGALLAAAFRRPLLCVPRYQGRRGHPIWFSRELIAEFLAAPEGGAARDVVRRHATETEFIDLDDAGILADIDDPAAYRSLMGTAS
jgi:molybdenum cofactor cytidylyltransferase